MRRPLSVLGHLFGAAGAPPPGVDALASLSTLRERSMQATVSAPSRGNKGESATTSSPFSFVGGDLSWELSNEGGLEMRDVEGIGYQDLVSISSRFTRTEADGPMNMDTVHQEVAFGNPEGIGPTDRFGPYAQGGIVADLPTTTLS